MTFLQLLKEDRSYRGYLQTPRPSREQLFQLVALTRLCPSSGNVQPLKYRLVHDTDTCNRVLPLTRWGGRMREPRLPRDGMAPTAYIVLLHDLSIAPNSAAFQKDVGIAAHTLLLGAVELGFGGCMIGAFSAAKLSEALALPSKWQPMLVVALGTPAEIIELEDAPPGFVDRDHCFYRDGNDVHHVYKRPINEIIV